MSVTTFSELKTAVSDRLQRADMSAGSTAVAEFIAFTERRMQRRLSAMDMETVNVSFPVVSEYVPTPADFLQVRQFFLNTASRVQLRFMPSELMTLDYPSGSGTPQFWCVEGNNFRFAPAPATTYNATLIYYQKIPALSATVTTNWVLSDHPDAYLYGSCFEGAIRKQDADAAQGYKMLFEEALQQIESDARRSRWSGPGLVTMPG